MSQMSGLGQDLDRARKLLTETAGRSVLNLLCDCCCSYLEGMLFRPVLDVVADRQTGSAPLIGKFTGLV